MSATRGDRPRRSSSGRHAGLALLDELPDIDAADVARCARVLLRRPLLRAEGPDGDLLPLVYRHRAVLVELFTTVLGYRLVVERRFARLYKTGPGQDATRGEPGLTPRGYAYLTLAVACLTGAGRQILLSRLVADIRAAAIEAGIPVVDDYGDRRALTAGLRHLVALGVISETEGSVGPWSTEAPAEALITVDTDLLGLLVAGPLREAEDGADLVALAARPGARGVEHALRRRLVEDPVVTHAELTDAESTWLRRNQRRESVLLDRAFGLMTETRLEGVAVTDPEEYLTDVVFPGTGTVARIALLALPELLGLREPNPDGTHSVTTAEVFQTCDDLVNAYPAAWSRQATEDPHQLCREVLALLERLGLAASDGRGGWTLSPAGHRWAPTADDQPLSSGAARSLREPAEPPAAPPVWSLFDEG
ncbi:TIGR02678 family protein [Actinoalloteichus spitiensis]|uniref:TIGR02678 family protein n=1 Tax=Actinoalloteichus spitiensis TaxID=252394 RepID=UPI001FE1EDFE|nr:TIGR02678 family protein [Actinoalloteichus spitiensis]